MKVGIIGLGSIGTRHALNVIALGHEVLPFDTAKSEISSAAHWQRIVCDSDAVLICTPASSHAFDARSLLEEGWDGPLFVEKPLALSSEECDVFRTWPHPTTQVGYMLRFHPATSVMRHIGPRDVRLISRCDMTTWPGSAYGSPLLEMSHEIDLATYIGAGSLQGGFQCDDDVSLRFGGGDIVVFLNWAAADYQRSWRVHGTLGSLVLDYSTPDQLGFQMYRDEIAHFLDCAEKGIPTITPFADGLRVLDVCEQAERLAKQTA